MAQMTTRILKRELMKLRRNIGDDVIREACYSDFSHSRGSNAAVQCPAVNSKKRRLEVDRTMMKQSLEWELKIEMGWPGRIEQMNSTSCQVTFQV